MFHHSVTKLSYPESVPIPLNPCGAKFQTAFVVCIFILTNHPFGKMFICKVERLNVKQRRSRWDGSLSRLIWIYAVCKCLLLSPVALKELIRMYDLVSETISALWYLRLYRLVLTPGIIYFSTSLKTSSKSSGLSGASFGSSSLK